MSIEEKLFIMRFNLDKEAHIKINKEVCLECVEKPCQYVCPVTCYRVEGGKVVFDWAGCLECGACRIVCEVSGKGSITWEYPRGGFGVCYRYG